MIRALGAYHGDVDVKITSDTLARDALGPHPWVRVIVAENADGLQAYAALLPLAKIVDGLRGIDINHMYVAEGLRGQGIGRQLIYAAADIARTLGCSYMFIGTAPENVDAQAHTLPADLNAGPMAGHGFAAPSDRCDGLNPIVPWR